MEVMQGMQEQFSVRLPRAEAILGKQERFSVRPPGMEDSELYQEIRLEFSD